MDHQLDWQQIVHQLTPSLFEELNQRDVSTVRDELESLGFLTAILNGKMDDNDWSRLEGHPVEDFRLFLASQVATQYLNRTITILRSREHSLESALKELEDEVYEIHEQYEQVKHARKQISIETQKIDEEIAACDRLLKSTSTTPPRASSPFHKNRINMDINSIGQQQQQQIMEIEIDNHRFENEDDEDEEEEEDDDYYDNAGEDDDDEDSPWETGMGRHTNDSHIRSSLVLNTTLPSPMARSIPGFHHNDPISPKYSRSRASSGTSGGAEDDDMVLFGTLTNSNQTWFTDKVKDIINVKKPLEGINETNTLGSGDEEEDRENDEFF